MKQALSNCKSVSQYFSIESGVHQGGILSSKLFALFMNGLSGAVLLCKASCYINDQCMIFVLWRHGNCSAKVTLCM